MSQLSLANILSKKPSNQPSGKQSSQPANQPSQCVNPGNGLDRRYELYFPENNCMYKMSNDMSKCPSYPYPLQNVKSCRAPCAPADLGIYGQRGHGNVDASYVASSLYGDALAFNGSDGSFYYQNVGINQMPMSQLTLDSYQQTQHVNFSAN